MKRVLSIQSHVVHGHVGNCSVSFPLQLLEYQVDLLNTVQFSNHTGYPHFTGHVFESNHLLEIVDGLDKNGLLGEYSHVLSGYLKNVQNVQAIHSIIKRIKQINSNVVYVFDPVIGDDGVYYIPKEIIPLYRELLCPISDFITPNQFEAEILSDIKIVNVESAKNALLYFHNLGVKNVIITSAKLDNNPDKLFLFGSYKNEADEFHPFMIEFPELKGKFTGTGDLTASLILGHYYNFSSSTVAPRTKLLKTCLTTLSTVQAVLHNTLEYAKSNLGPNVNISSGHGKLSVEAVKNMELRLVHSRKEVLEPREWSNHIVTDL